MTIPNTVGSLFKRLRSGAQDDPVRDWLVVLMLSTVLLIGSIVWNMWAFDTVARGGRIGGGPSAGESPMFNQSSLDSIHALFENRASEAAKYETGVYRYADPSQ